MKWTKRPFNPANDDYERWILTDDGERRWYAIIDRNLSHKFTGMRTWEFGLVERAGYIERYEGFPRGKWTIEKRLDYVAVLARMI